MLLISLLLAVFLKQFWEPSNPLHHDNWLASYQQQLLRHLTKISITNPTAVFAVGLIIPVATTAAIDIVLHQESKLLHLIFAAAVLLYSFGRGEFTQHITQFIVAEAKQDWARASDAAQKLHCDTSTLENNDWQALNTRFLSQASYLGFERFFAVVFWFVVLGPAGAFAYRLTQLWLQRLPSQPVARWLWVIEWPAIRILGLTYAVTGNFGGCINAWKKSVFCQTRSSQSVLLDNMLGALAVDETLAQTPEVTRRELEALQQLLSRTLWCWLGVIGVLYMM
ncbi:regulatory signaling modulator protein AmpE [Marinagarivorans cellulosilyticus]|uniref:AmpE protein n=1 Tax=Marinagarivorans cellulosilyticus TaxID=2721545 RepID=A0AAN1WJ11_9GAMM|nr:regulatory signaling modulator protein AmpE [Marinagarivorans cellulosilyticus]BCD98450.1 AmpE protein [Marinagarivorans cellulosilyticus]